MTVLIEKSPKSFRVEDLLNPDLPEKFVEIIEGELVVMNPSGRKHNEVGYHFVRLFEEFCRTRPQLHFASGNTGYLLRRDPDVLLCPDASMFVWRECKDQPWVEFAPDIAVEVLSESNNASEIAYKRRKYFDGGTEQVWIADMDSKTIEFWHRDGRRVIVRGDETVKGEGLADGMEIDLRKIFAVRN